MIQVWQRIFPRLLKRKEEMPKSLMDHVRYPEDFLLAQGLVYAKYHMTDPAVFYNQEDLWVRATEKHYQNIVPVDPYYVMWDPQGGRRGAEFSLILPFTPKNRQVLIGWMAGLCDGENYGRLISYNFPKQEWILGPQQVDTKIDQDPILSQKLALWDQRGSRVIRGNVLAIPLDQTLLYVEPIYIQSEAAAYPELRLVVAMHGDHFSYAESFQDALAGLFDDMEAKPTTEIVEPGTIQNAQEAFDNYIQFMSERRYIDAGRELEKLANSLRDMGSHLESETSH